MPTNWKHYIGLDLANLEDDVERILSLSEDDLKEISENGRNWAWEYYSPVAVTERILSIAADKVISSL